MCRLSMNADLINVPVISPIATQNIASYNFLQEYLSKSHIQLHTTTVPYDNKKIWNIYKNMIKYT